MMTTILCRLSCLAPFYFREGGFGYVFSTAS